jgi:23S rRNA pseudouridine1911/1915/1917 synthase
MSIQVPVERQGERIDQVLVSVLSDQSRASVQRLIREGHVLMQGEPVRAAYRVHGGEAIDLTLPPPRSSGLEAEPYPLDILFEDRDLVVVNKPAGISVHPGAGSRSGTLVNALLHHCNDLSGIGGEERPGIVHRLDRDTTGVLLVAKNDAVRGPGMGATAIHGRLHRQADRAASNRPGQDGDPHGGP